MLKIGDKLICIVKNEEDISYGRSYEVVFVRDLPENDICIKDNSGYNWWFGQIGSSEPWTRWFTTEKEWNRNNKIDTLLN